MWSIMMYMLLVASVVWGYHEYKDVWSERSGKFASAFASGMERLSSSHPRSLCTHGHAQLLSGSQEFYKMQINLDGVRYWQTTFNLPNSPEFLPPQFCTIW